MSSENLESLNPINVINLKLHEKKKCLLASQIGKRNLKPDLFQNNFNVLDEIDFNNNFLTFLPENLFHGLCFEHLSLLYINNNDLTELEPTVFKNLINL